MQSLQHQYYSGYAYGQQPPAQQHDQPPPSMMPPIPMMSSHQFDHQQAPPHLHDPLGQQQSSTLPPVNGKVPGQKRKQVKNACVNCQKACKKCDDGRPCQRCIKFGLTDTCVNSVRKERKKGVKRGPYKRRVKGEQGSASGSVVDSNNSSPQPSSLYDTPSGSPALRSPLPFSAYGSAPPPYGQHNQYDAFAYQQNYGYAKDQSMLGQQSNNVSYMMPGQHPMYHHSLPYQMVVPSQPGDVLARSMSHSPSSNVQQQQQQHQRPPQQQQQQHHHQQPQQQQSTPRSETNEDEDEEGNKLNILSQLCSAVLDHSDEDKPTEKKQSRSPPAPNGKPGYLNAQQPPSQQQQVYGTPGSSPGRMDDQKSWGLPSLQNVVNENHHPQQQQQQWVGNNHGNNGW
ncbi:hypothetical protein BGW37DRAFT_482797 [Umbelopsis sp. PMI_123]|nr:hypothetical protein BGW37DRAFT_482797 [Umbelopsis sp. PMI_123]